MSQHVSAFQKTPRHDVERNSRSPDHPPLLFLCAVTHEALSDLYHRDAATGPHSTSVQTRKRLLLVGKLGPDPKTVKCSPESQTSLWAELNLFPLSQRRCEKGYLPPQVRTTEKRATWSKMRVILNGRGLSVTKVKLTSVLETCYVPKRKSLK
ncbi:hypothetical protein QQP08_018583 [Theobroma cacao]|nr:hypothetical protein QQP08_018583 [Theobroma cacao]